ncbi:MAG: HDIG domain-containing protein [Chloroflexi bacterium]|nr:HDIG domain-containing protein [Chloroflexota bacterium]
MSREEAVAAVTRAVKNPNTVKHMLATEAIMHSLARRLGENEEEWGLTGLLHDIDVEMTETEPANHSRTGADLAHQMGVSPAVVSAILRHNEIHGLPRETTLEKALFCTDPLTGLMVAAALVRPDKKISGLTSSSVMKRLGEKRFAAGANREHIALCAELGLELEDFVALGLSAMQDIAPDLGL